MIETLDRMIQKRMKEEVTLEEMGDILGLTKDEVIDLESGNEMTLYQAEQYMSGIGYEIQLIRER